MTLINFDKIILDFNNYIKKYEKISYKKIINEYKIFLKKKYRLKNNKNYINTFNLLINYINNNNLDIKIPNLEDKPFAYCFRNINNKNIKYDIVNELGSGFYGSVSKVIIDDKIYALKKMSLLRQDYFDDSNEYFLKVYDNELKYLKIINKIKPKIAPTYYKSWIDNNNLYILVEYINCGTLLNYMKNNKLSIKDKNYIKKIINILHKHKIIHYDLHAENILVECKNNKINKIYLNDFGITKSFKDSKNIDYIRIEEDINIVFSEKKNINNKLKYTSTKNIVIQLTIDYIINNNLLSIIKK